MRRDQDGLGARQIKAARSLLDWSQEDLAEAAGLSVATIRKMELGDISPRLTTNEALRKAFEEEGLEFLPPDGVRHKPEGVQTYEGKGGLRAFFDDVYHTVQKTGGSIVVVCASEEPFMRFMGADNAMHLLRMTALRESVSVRAILTESTKDLPATGYCEYRTISKSYVDSVPFYVYGDKYAIIVFSEREDPKITVIESAAVAKAFRQQFASLWDKAQLVSRPNLSAKVIAFTAHEWEETRKEAQG